jgi:hypothetical protein
MSAVTQSGIINSLVVLDNLGEEYARSAVLIILLWNLYVNLMAI